MQTRIILADNSDLMLFAMQIILEKNPQNQVIETARNVDDLVIGVASHKPHITFIDEKLYDRHVFDLLQQITDIHHSLKIVISGSLADGLLIRDLFHAGVHAYLYKSDDLCSCLTTAVDMVLRDRKYLSPTANAEYLVAMQSPERDWHLDQESRAVLKLLAQGYRACEIAEELNIDTRRVYFIRQKLRRRFGADSNEHLIAVAVAEGFIYL